MNEEQLEVMHNVKKILAKIPAEHQREEYKTICKQVNDYFFLHCQHEFEKDLFDIDPDKSVTVTYCTKCFYIKR